MALDIYAPPLDQLLDYGEPTGFSEKWPDYLSLGFHPQHIPDLIRMATDQELSQADPKSREVWAPTHAWRVLGQLRAEEAVSPLLRLFDEYGDDDWVSDDLPKAIGLIGPAAIPEVAAYLADEAHGGWPRLHASTSLVRLAENYPDALPQCAAVLVHQLEKFDSNDPLLNGALIGDLEDLKYTDAAPLMERALASGRVDESITGDWYDVQVALGLREPDADYEAARGGFLLRQFPDLFSAAAPGTTSGEASRPARAGHRAKQKARTKRQQAKASRRKNRKRG